MLLAAAIDHRPTTPATAGYIVQGADLEQARAAVAEAGGRDLRGIDQLRRRTVEIVGGMIAGETE